MRFKDESHLFCLFFTRIKIRIFEEELIYLIYIISGNHLYCCVSQGGLGVTHKQLKPSGMENHLSYIIKCNWSMSFMDTMDTAQRYLWGLMRKAFVCMSLYSASGDFIVLMNLFI